MRAFYGLNGLNEIGGLLEGAWEEETGNVFEGEQRLLLAHFVAPRPDWSPNHIGFVFDGGRLTSAQVRSLAEWEAIMTPAGFARLPVIDHARRTGTVAYLEG